MSVQATEPLSIGGVLDSGFNLFRACLGSVFVLALAGALVSAPLSYLGARAPGEPPQVGGGALVALLVGLLVVMIVSLVIYGAIIARIGAVARGQPLPIGAALGVGLRRGPALLGAAILYSLAIMIGLFLLLVPGLWLMVSLMFSLYAVVLDGKGPIASLKYSYGLVRGHWWRTTAIVTVVVIIVSVIYFVIGIIAGVAAAFDPDQLLQQGRLPWYVDFIVMPLMTAVFVPLMYAMLYAVYHDLKLRHAGGDLAERIAAASR